MTFLELIRRMLRPKDGVIDPRVTFNEDGTVNNFLYFSSRTNSIHGAVDINYGDGINPSGQYSVYAPVSGEVLPLAVNNFGSVLIRSSADGTLHRISHLSNIAVSANTQVTAGVTELGKMSNVAPPEWGTLAVHIHYEVYLPDSDGWQYTDLRIDPIIYWTPGATPVNDVNGNGIIDDPAPGTGTSEIGAVVREGGKSYLKVGVNTPHTRAIELRIEFTNAPAGFRAVDRTGTYAVYWNDTEKAAYVTLPPTTNQSTPNTSTVIELFMPEENGDTKNEFLTYTVTAGYLVTDTADRNVQNWFDFNQTSTIFTPASGSLFVLDNGMPAPPPFKPSNVITIDTPHAEQSGDDFFDGTGVLVGGRDDWDFWGWGGTVETGECHHQFPFAASAMGTSRGLRAMDGAFAA